MQMSAQTRETKTFMDLFVYKWIQSRESVAYFLCHKEDLFQIAFFSSALDSQEILKRNFELSFLNICPRSSEKCCIKTQFSSERSGLKFDQMNKFSSDLANVWRGLEIHLIREGNDMVSGRKQTLILTKT